MIINLTKTYYSTSEAAQILNLSRIAIFNRIKKGTLAAEKIGRNYIIHRDQLLKALGKSVGKENKADIEKAVNKAAKQYAETFKLLGKE